MQPCHSRRVLLLIHHLVIPGGAANYMFRLAEQLRDSGATVAILTLQVDRQRYPEPPGIEYLVVEGPLTSSLRYWLLFPFWQRKIHRRVRDWQPDVLVPQGFPANWWSWIFKIRNRLTPIVWICPEPSAFIHSMAWIRALRPWWKSLLARLLRPLLAMIDVALARYSDRIITNSRFTTTEVERVYGTKSDGIAYPGIDFSAFACEHWQKEQAIITVARLTRFKRVDFLLEVFSSVLKVHPDLTYHIVGTGEEERSLRELARKMGLESRVVFHGAATDEVLAGLYRRATLFLHGSVDEPFGMAPLEAIASGTPVIAHQSGGPAEFVTEACGRLVASMEVADWAREVVDYLHYLGDHPDFPQRVQECARSYDWPLSLRPAVKVILALRTEA